MKTKISLQWEGTFIEYCMGRVPSARQKLLENRQPAPGCDLQANWYENNDLLQSVFQEENWWAVDDMDHAMGFVFEDRPSMEKHLSGIVCEIDGSIANVDPREFNMRFYAPEPIPPVGKNDQVVCHGCLRQATMSLQAQIEGPVDPSMVTLSFINYPDIGLVLMDMDIDGHDELLFEWGETTYLQPNFLRKEEINGIAR